MTICIQYRCFRQLITILVSTGRAVSFIKDIERNKTTISSTLLKQLLLASVCFTPDSAPRQFEQETKNRSQGECYVMVLTDMNILSLFLTLLKNTSNTV